MRIHWVDTAKAIGIFTIVLGHTPGINEFLRSFIYAFHVPLFFFLSGILTKPAHLSMPFGEFVKRNVWRLVVPYVFFWFVCFLLWIVFQQVDGVSVWQRPGLVFDQIEGLMWGTGVALLAVNGALWFYTGLFVSTLAHYFIARLSPIKQAGVLVIFAMVGVFIRPIFAGEHLVWNIELIPVMVLFYGAGYLISKEGWMPKFSKPVWSLVAVVAFAATLAVTIINGNPDFSWHSWGRSYLLYIPGAFAGIALVIAIGHLARETKVARYLSENTITIFSIHYPIFTAFGLVGVHLFALSRDFDQHSTVLAFAYTLAALALCVPLVLLFRRFTPWALGAKPRTKI